MNLIFYFGLAAGTLLSAQDSAFRLTTGLRESHGINYLMAQSRAALAEIEAVRPEIARPAEGVTDLAFSELFGPIGDRGLEYSEKIQALAGKRVRVIGFMVCDPERTGGQFRLAGLPIRVEPRGACLMDDTPAAVVDVVAPPSIDKPLAWKPGRVVIEGTLEIGACTDRNGRNSFVRVQLDPVDFATLYHPPGDSVSSSR